MNHDGIKERQFFLCIWDFSFFLFFACIIGLIALFREPNLWTWMIVDCATNEPSEGNDKVMWLVIIVLTHLIGAAIHDFCTQAGAHAKVRRGALILTLANSNAQKGAYHEYHCTDRYWSTSPGHPAPTSASEGYDLGVSPLLWPAAFCGFRPSASLRFFLLLMTWALHAPENISAGVSVGGGGGGELLSGPMAGTSAQDFACPANSSGSAGSPAFYHS